MKGKNENKKEMKNEKQAILFEMLLLISKCSN